MKQIALIFIVLAIWMEFGACKPRNGGGGGAGGDLGAQGQVGFGFGANVGGSAGAGADAGGQEEGHGGPKPRGPKPKGPPGGGLISSLYKPKANCRRQDASSTTPAAE